MDLTSEITIDQWIEYLIIQFEMHHGDNSITANRHKKSVSFFKNGKPVLHLSHDEIKENTGAQDFDWLNKQIQIIETNYNQ